MQILLINWSVGQDLSGEHPGVMMEEARKIKF